MRKEERSLLSRSSYSITSNVITLLTSIIIVLIVPKLIGIEEYGYWQLYLFYVSYIGFLQFGWTDGIYLKYGGEKYENLDKQLFFNQFWFLAFFQIFIILIGLIIIYIVGIEMEKKKILLMVFSALILTGNRAFISFVLLATNRIVENAKTMALGRTVYFITVFALILLGIRNYKILIFSEILGRLVTLLYSIYFFKDILQQRFMKMNGNSIKKNLVEASENIRIGIKLMFSNIASMLIIGIIRFGVETSWDVKVFGKISLTLSLSNLVLTFVNTIGLIIFPILKRTELDKLPKMYIFLRNTLMPLILGLLLTYYPLKLLLIKWIPKYGESLIYMAIVFPVCIFESKMALLISTYLKVYRKERELLKVNSKMVLISLIGTYITAIVLKNLMITIVMIPMLLAIRVILMEKIISNILKIKIRRDLIMELCLCGIFMLSGWYIRSWLSFNIYLLSYLIYMIKKYPEIKNSIVDFKQITRIKPYESR